MNCTSTQYHERIDFVCFKEILLILLRIRDILVRTRIRTSD
jgi:hypothetical protein